MYGPFTLNIKICAIVLQIQRLVLHTTKLLNHDDIKKFCLLVSNEGMFYFLLRLEGVQVKLSYFYNFIKPHTGTFEILAKVFQELKKVRRKEHILRSISLNKNYPC